MKFNIETEREEDGRWIAEITDLPGVMSYGDTRDDAIARVQAIAEEVSTPEPEARRVIACWPPFIKAPFQNRDIGPRMQARIDLAERRAWGAIGIDPSEERG
jgi:predicted RNase H-like HicB family nuclease